MLTDQRLSEVTSTAPTVESVSALFFSRGKGRGHAIPDLEILRELKQIDSGVDVQFVSYATGAATFKAEGHSVVDLALPEDNSFVDTIILAYRAIRDLQPKVVISHEEFGALVAARLAHVPSIYIAAWLPPTGSVAAESLTSAEAIIMIERPGIFPSLPGLTARPEYVGPILRKMKYSLEDRPRLRNELGMEHDALAILVVQAGGWTEESAPICDTVLSAFLAVRRPSKRLYWLAGKDFDFLQKRTAGVPGVEVIEYCTPVERLIVPCDVVITKGTHQITLDAATLGVPSISLSAGLNPIDDALVPRIHNNVALMANAVDSLVLLEYIDTVTSATAARPPAWTRSDAKGAERAAAIIVETIRRVVTE